MFNVNNKDTRTTPGVVLLSLLLTLNIFSHLVLVFLLLTLSRQMPAGLLVLGFPVKLYGKNSVRIQVNTIGEKTYFYFLLFKQNYIKKSFRSKADIN